MGDDTYLVDGSVSFPDSAVSLVNRFEERFFAQTETGWALLKEVDPGAFVRPAETAPGVSRIDLRLGIPLSIPGLFRTYEGDVSLMQKIRYECTNRSGGKSMKEEELLYWITPRTSKWILREGM